MPFIPSSRQNVIVQLPIKRTELIWYAETNRRGFKNDVRKDGAVRDVFKAIRQCGLMEGFLNLVQG